MYRIVISGVVVQQRGLRDAYFVFRYWPLRLFYLYLLLFTAIMSSATPSIFTPTSAFSLAGVAGVGLLAYIASKALLPKNSRWQDRYTFIWLVCVSRSSARPPALDPSIQAFDALIHFSFEGSWLYLSTFGRQVITSEGPLAEMCTFPFPPLQLHQAQRYATRERIHTCRLQMGHCRSYRRLPRTVDRPRRWTLVLLHPQATRL